MPLENYSPCGRTYAGLRIWHEDMAFDPNKLTEQLQIQPTESFSKGDITDRFIKRRHSYWGISSKDAIDSLDVQQHVTWLLDFFVDREETLAELQIKGYEMDIFCFWESNGRPGGPILAAALMTRLAALNLCISFDIYFLGDL